MLRSQPQLGMQCHEIEETSLEMIPFCTKNTSQQFYPGIVLLVKKSYPTTPNNPQSRTLKTSVLQIDFLGYKQNTCVSALTMGDPQQSRTLPGTKPHTACISA